MFEEVKELLVKQLKLKDASVIRPETKIQAELDADSIDILQLLMALEEKKGITIPDEDLVKFVTVQDIVEYLEKIG
jgi:acyl carrier protein